MKQPMFLAYHWVLDYLRQNPLVLAMTLSVGLLLLLAILLRRVLHRSTAPATVKGATDRSGPGSSASVGKGQNPSKSVLKDPDSPSEVEHIRKMSRSNWLHRLKQGMSKSRQSLQAGFGKALASGKIDESTLEELHEVLYRADTGVQTTDKLIEHVGQLLKGQHATWEEVHPLLVAKSRELFQSSSQHSTPAETGPRVILIVGVNGVGKTTTIGKLASHFLAQGKEVILCAADTYRAAAIDQLKIWGKRLGVRVIAQQHGSDPAAVAYDAVKAAKAKNADVLLIDTAGRLHSKQELMQELNKIKRVTGKDLAGAPHETWLVIDATTGQNAFAQARAFDQVVPLSGLIVTKLDGTARGGVIIGVSDETGIPVRYIGVGESACDLREFDPDDYLASLFAKA